MKERGWKAPKKKVAKKKAVKKKAAKRKRNPKSYKTKSSLRRQNPRCESFFTLAWTMPNGEDFYEFYTNLDDAKEEGERGMADLGWSWATIDQVHPRESVTHEGRVVRVWTPKAKLSSSGRSRAKKNPKKKTGGLVHGKSRQSEFRRKTKRPYLRGEKALIESLEAMKMELDPDDRAAFAVWADEELRHFREGSQSTPEM
jgi:hypothetical protein